MSLKSAKPIQKRPALLKMMVYGRPGTGKTSLAGSFPGPILILDVRENGTDSISNVENVDVLEIPSTAYISDVQNELRNDTKYKTVVIDSMTMLQQMLVNEVKKQLRGKPLTFKEWGNIGGTLNDLILGFRDLNKHILFICQDKVQKGADTDEDADDLDPQVGAMLMPSVEKTLNGAVSVIGNTFIRELRKVKEGKKTSRMQYRLRLGAHPYYITKVRAPSGSIIPESIINPTFDQIVAITKGQYNV